MSRTAEGIFVGVHTHAAFAVEPECVCVEPREAEATQDAHTQPST